MNARKSGFIFLVSGIALLILLPLVSAQENLVGFQEFQSIATNGAMDWEFFTIGNDFYLQGCSVLQVKVQRTSVSSQNVACHCVLAPRFSFS